MPTQPGEGPKLKRDWVGLEAELARPVRTSMAKFPAGASVRIESHSRTGFVVVSNPCSLCGVSVIIRGLKTKDLRLTTPKVQWPDTRKRR